MVSDFCRFAKILARDSTNNPQLRCRLRYGSSVINISGEIRIQIPYRFLRLMGSLVGYCDSNLFKEPIRRGHRDLPICFR